jgi:2-oxoglutarate ferredoxin oxidoreductase subunit beta
MNIQGKSEKPAAKDYASDQEVRWCPGCGDYAIIRSIQRTLAELQAAPEKTVFISGIGCAARFPYYMETYGFHTIHGRAAAIATGVKLANPDLDVWVISGDGDALSIGGNHLLHLLRRNVNLQFLLFNNEIYGLTKGQYSPTSQIGTRSPSTPMGSVDNPVSPVTLALGAGARFVARSVDSLLDHLPGVLTRAHVHKGASFVEIFQNCKVYNDGIYEHFTAKMVAAERQVMVEHGKPLLFGENKSKGLRMKPGRIELEAVSVGPGGVPEGDVLVHDETNRTIATLLANMDSDTLPVALGVLYCDPASTYEDAVYAQLAQAKEGDPGTTLNDLLHAGPTWVVD